MRIRVRSAVVARVAALTAAAVTALALAPSASAEATATVSDLRSADGHVTGSLVIRGVDPAKIDTTQVIARVDGKSAVVTLSPATSSPRTTMLVIDTSGSMGPAGMATTRAAVADFLAAAPKDVKVGVVSFANTAGVDLKPTLDRRKVQRVVNGLKARGETSLYAGVQTAVAALGTTGERSIVLLSDGEDTVADDAGGGANERAQFAAATRALAAGKVRAEVVAFKNEAGRAALTAFAKAGGGTVVSADDRGAVKAAFDTAAKTLASQVRFDLVVPTGLEGVYDISLEGTADGQSFKTVQRADVTASEPVVDDSALGALPEGVVNGQARAAQVASVSGVFLPIAVGAMLLAVFILVVILFAPAFRSKRRARIEEIHEYGMGASATPGQGGNQSQLSEQLIQMGDRVMSGRESTTKTMQRIERADLPWRAGEWFLIRFLCLAIGVVAFTLLIGGKSLLLAIVAGIIVGLLFPVFALRYLANRRAKRFEAVLPDVMMLVATSLSSGFSLLQALDSVARDAAEPAAKEFSRALAESRIGADISDALEHVAVRMESDNMRWAVMAIRIQREVGGNLADTLRTTAATLREREMLKRHVRALSAEGRLSAYILIALPIGVLLFSMYSNYDYVSLLWTTLPGMLMSFMGILAMLFGIWWMRKTVQIEV
ncbi:MAG TPA: type II secretion system F family protein [Ornithinibacter sp.]|nr:type II secretion system F family protein [Ornithinibacter sp.]